MPLFAFSAYVDGRLAHGELVATDADQARAQAVLFLHGEGKNVELRQVFEPPMRRREALGQTLPGHPPRVNFVRGHNYRASSK